MSYSILFNALSSQIVNLEDIMKKSFGENTKIVALKALKDKRNELLENLNNKKIECEFVAIEEDAPIESYIKKGDIIYNLAGDFYSRIYAAKEMNLPKFAHILDINYNIHLALLMRYNKTYKGEEYITSYDAVVVRYASKTSNKLNTQDRPIQEIVYEEGMPYLESYTFKCQPYEVMEVFHSKHRIVDYNREIDPSQLIEEFQTFQKLIDKKKVKTIEYRNSLKSNHTLAVYSELTESIKQFNLNKCSKCHLKNQHVDFISNIAQNQDKYNKIEKEITDSEVIFGFKETEAMLEILQELKYTNDSNLPQLKTRVARELGGGGENLYLTEILMDNVLEDLSEEEIVPLVSIFVAHGRSKEEVNFRDLGLPDTLVTGIQKCVDVFDMIKKLEVDREIETEEELNFLMIKPLLEWAKGRDFVEIMEHTDVLEGAIVRTIQRVEQTMRNIKRALVLIGNSTMVEKVGRAADLIKRDIAFFLSLYIDQSKTNV